MDKKNILVLDIECSSEYNISSEFDKYIETAKVKWIGFYSYKSDKVYVLKAEGNEDLIRRFIQKHGVVVTFNGANFDLPILKNSVNRLWPEGYRHHIDLKEVLVGRAGRGYLMGYKFKKHSLREIAKTMNLEVAKGEIDYTLFEKVSWNSDEEKEIREYTKLDILVTKAIFDKVWDFWLPFTNFINEKNRQNYSWITSSEGSLAYKYACFVTGLPEEYGEKGKKTEGGGRVIEPRVLEAWNVAYIDVRSLYPHMFAMFNLFAEVSAGTPGAWHGNEVFKVKGYYDISSHHPLAKDMMEKLRARMVMKKKDPNNPLAYTYKILLNSTYGAARSTVFTSLYKPNCGADCCWLGRQVNEIMERMMTEKGYEVLAGDTDSLFIRYPNGREIDYQKLKDELKEISNFINAHVPFPQPETFEIEIEAIIPYIMFHRDESGHTLKKNYCYIKKKVGKPNEIVVMGLPIKKANATGLGWKIFETHIKPRMLKEIRGKFEKEWILKLIREEVEKDITLLAQEYRVQPYDSYSLGGRRSLSAQISKEYLDGNGGVIKLIKNLRVGRVGAKYKYCSLEEARRAKLAVSDLDLTKVLNELSPWSKEPLGANSLKAPRVQGFFASSQSFCSSKPVLETKRGFFE